MRLSPVRSLPFVLLGLSAACSMDPGVSGDTENVGRSSSAIINGTLDTAHPAVVALILAKGNQNGLCSGTIVKKDVQRGIGWVATAAHCVADVPPTLVVQAEDLTSPSALRYDVIDFKADPRYSGRAGDYDYAMVRIAGVDASTPVIPLTGAPDGVVGGVSGTRVTSVGFGRTTLIESTSSDQNTQRRSVSKRIDQTTSLLISYDMRSDGICQGDSGGPVLVGAVGSERVVGIHSFVENDCDGRGYSMRVEAGLSFFETELSKALPSEDCSLCQKRANSGMSECVAMEASCLADENCKGYYECLSAGKKRADCFKKYPLGEGPFNATANCVCGRACTEQCEGSSACRSAPKCGYEMKAGTCTTCVEQSCCAEEADCVADGQCYVCLKDKDADPACATNAARKKLATCAVTRCKTECAGSPLQNGGEDEAPEPEEAPAQDVSGGKTTTTTTTGCSAALGASGSSAWALAISALALAGARRRRRG